MKILYSYLRVGYVDVWKIRGIFRTLFAIYDKAFLRKKLKKIVNYFPKKLRLPL